MTELVDGWQVPINVGPPRRLHAFAVCNVCGTKWKQRIEQRDRAGAVIVTGLYVGRCRLCGRCDLTFEYEGDPLAGSREPHTPPEVGMSPADTAATPARIQPPPQEASR